MATPNGARGLHLQINGEDGRMTSTALNGKRCRIMKWVNGPAGRIEPMTEGKILYVSENLGRLLFLVDWDRGGSSVIFPEEVELLEAAA
jgi:hypothetical protein